MLLSLMQSRGKVDINLLVAESNGRIKADEQLELIRFVTCLLGKLPRRDFRRGFSFSVALARRQFQCIIRNRCSELADHQNPAIITDRHNCSGPKVINKIPVLFPSVRQRHPV